MKELPSIQLRHVNGAQNNSSRVLLSNVFDATNDYIEDNRMRIAYPITTGIATCAFILGYLERERLSLRQIPACILTTALSTALYNNYIENSFSPFFTLIPPIATWLAQRWPGGEG